MPWGATPKRHNFLAFYNLCQVKTLNHILIFIVLTKMLMNFMSTAEIYLPKKNSSLCVFRIKIILSGI